jgi:2-polyprenyl-3-methyl-5-hydroxy-6-metoxy-1,4-benzoquinol methylase
MQTEVRQSEVWQAVWANAQLTKESVFKKVKRETRTKRWQAIRKALLGHFGTIQGLATLEMGSGAGDISLLLALEGAVPTLLDAEEKAFSLARLQFGAYGLEARYLLSDFFNLDSALLGDFDVAVSYGTVEHFAGEDRLRACLAHKMVLKPNGMVVISVPNAHCLPYRLNKWRQEITGKWHWGLEIPYTRSELGKIAHMMGLKSWTIHGSSFLRDWDQFLLTPLTSRIEKYLGFHFERWTPVDRYLGHAITLIGNI